MIRIIEEKESMRNSRVDLVSKLSDILRQGEITENGYRFAITDMQKLRTICDQLIKTYNE